MTGETITGSWSRGRVATFQAAEYCSSAVVWLEKILTVISLTQHMYKGSRMFSTKTSMDVGMVHCVSDTTCSYIEILWKKSMTLLQPSSTLASFC